MISEDQLREELEGLPPALDLGASADEIAVRGRRRRFRNQASLMAGALAVTAVAGSGIREVARFGGADVAGLFWDVVEAKRAA